MRIKLEKRPAPSVAMMVLTPVLSVLLTMLIGVIVFDFLGVDGFGAVRDIFLTLAKEPHFVVVDGAGDEATVFQRVLRATETQ